jgi:hypothetical protein
LFYADRADRLLDARDVVVNGNVSESNLLAKPVIGWLATRVMDHRSLISLGHPRSGETGRLLGFWPRHQSCKTRFYESWKRPRRVIARSSDKIQAYKTS